ncbi:MAG: hypothetical protein Ta2B_11110 [Termitinemataceae bacterium]|nr:MAG: hypothetical protein Ta2B_11110 [Termitinemataceae bacterium]
MKKGKKKPPETNKRRQGVLKDLVDIATIILTLIELARFILDI